MKENGLLRLSKSLDNACIVNTGFNLWSPGGSFMVQNMAITFLIPAFKGGNKIYFS